MKQWKTWLGFIISVGIIYLAFRGIHFRVLIANLRQADYRYLLPIIAVIFLNIALRAVRWGYLLRPVKQIGFHNLFESILISFMANNVLPVRMGEFVRAYVIGRSERISTSASFATVVLERLFDGLTIVGLLVVVMICVQLPAGTTGNISFTKWLVIGGSTTMAICVLTVVILVLIKTRSEWVLKVTASLVRPFSAKLAQNGIATIISFKKGLLAVESTSTMAIAFFYSLLLWAIYAIAIYLMGFAFGLTLSLAVTCSVLLAICLAVMIPSTPGYIGPYHASVAYALVLFNIPLEQALSFSIVFHAVNYLPVTLAGFLYLGRHHLTLQKIRVIEGKTVVK